MAGSRYMQLTNFIYNCLHGEKFKPIIEKGQWYSVSGRNSILRYDVLYVCVCVCVCEVDLPQIRFVTMLGEIEGN